MKKVLIYTERWCAGGIESLITNIVEKINREKFIPIILVSQKETEVYDKRLKLANCNIIETLSQKYSNPMKRIIENMKVFKQKIEKIKPDIIHINTYNGIGLIYAKMAKNVGISNIILHAHNSGIDNDKFKIKSLIHNISKLIVKVKGIKYIACSTKAGDFCFGKKNKIDIINNGIDTEKYHYCLDIRNKYRKEFNLQDSLVIGNVARFVKQKNHIFLLKLLKELTKQVENVKLILVGEGELQDSIKQQAIDMNIEENIIFLGTRSDVNNLMQMMDVFVFPSLYEGLGIVLIEAESTGLPCVISENIPKEAILIHDNVSILNLDDDIEKWVNEIIKFSKKKREDKVELIKNMGYDRIENIKKIEEIYENKYEEELL